MSTVELITPEASLNSGAVDANVADIEYEPDATPVNFKQELRKKVMRILELRPEDDPFWEITDGFDEGEGRPVRLVLVNHTARGEKILPEIRGLIVDVEQEFVFGERGPEPQKIVLDELTYGMELPSHPEADISKTSFAHAFDGVIVRVFLWDGHIFIASRKKLDLSRSRWTRKVLNPETGLEIEPPTFLEMFEKGMGKNSIEDLFDAEASYSPVIHAFVVNDPSLRVADRYRGGLFLNYLEPLKFWGPENCPYPLDEVDFNVQVPQFFSTELQLNNTQPYIYRDPGMSHEQINRFLKSSFENDPAVLKKKGSHGLDCDGTDIRTWPGGAVVMYLRNSEGMLLHVVNIMSTSWVWRMMMRDNRANLALSMYKNAEYLQDAIQKGDEHALRSRQRYDSMFPTLMKLPVSKIRENANAQNISCWPSVDNPLTNDTEMQINMLNCELIAAPWHRQPEVFALRLRMLQEEPLIKKWLLGMVDMKPQQIRDSLEPFDRKNVHGQFRATDRVVTLLDWVNRKNTGKTPAEKRVMSLKLIGADLQSETGENRYRLSRLYYDSNAKRKKSN